MRVTLAIYPVLLLLICLAARAHPERLWWLAGGAGIGTLLGVFGLKMTRFEATPNGLYYTPHAHLGIAISLLFVARIAYRLFTVFANGSPTSPGMTDFTRSPLTLALLGVLAGYYIAYAVGLLRWRLQLVRAGPQRESSAAGRGTMSSQPHDPTAEPGLPPSGQE